MFGITTGAAEIAVDLMLQENFSHPLTRILSWYAIVLRLKELQSDPEEIPNNDEPEDDGVSLQIQISWCC